MAPEQATVGGRVSAAVDRFALGLVAFRLLTGEGYHGTDVLQIVSQLLYTPMPPPSKRHPALGAAFDAWFARACAREPERRFATAGEQVEALAAALGLPAR
jgi:serine/threonine-protein kinase